MDPLSIAASSASLVVLCIKVSATLYTWVDDTRQVDTNVSALCEEILALSRVLDAISKTWKTNPQIISTQADSGMLWFSVKASIDDCKATLEKMALMLDDIQTGGFMGRGFMKRSVKQIKFGLKTKDIVVYQQRVQSYNGAMQSALHMINLSLLLQSASSQDAVTRTLSDLKSQIGRVEGALTANTLLPNYQDEREESERISRNLHRFVRLAESFHSSASTVAGSGSTVWGGSMFGDPLTQDQMFDIEGWIPPPGFATADHGEDNTSSTGLSASVSDPLTTRSSMTETENTISRPNEKDSDSDSDIEKDLTKKIQELAVIKLGERDYEKAEKFFLKAIDRSTAEGNSIESMTSARINLALTYCFQGKWEEAEGIIVPIAMGKQNIDITVFHGLHTLALLFYGRKDLETAEKYCKRTLIGKKKILGKDHDSYLESIQLLSVIYSARGDEAESEVYRSFLPAAYTGEPPRSALEYLRKTMPASRSSASELLSSPSAVTLPNDPARQFLSSISNAKYNVGKDRPTPRPQRTNWRTMLGINASGSRSSDELARGAATYRTMAPKAPLVVAIQHIEENTWTDAWTKKDVEPGEVQDLIRGCTLELKLRALDMAFLLLPFRPSSDISAARSFIRNFFDRAQRLRGKELVDKLRLTEPTVLCSVLKWCWSRIPGGVVGWEAYELFKVGETDSNLARHSFATFIPLTVESDARVKIIFDFFDLLSSIASHSKRNGHGGRQLSRLAGWWAFDYANYGFNCGYEAWVIAADATSHLFFAYLRSLTPDLLSGLSGISTLPILLQKLVNETEYPPQKPALLFSSTRKLMIIVDSVSPTPLALLQRKENFQYHDKDDRVLQSFTEYEDPVNALTDECQRVLRLISSENDESTVGKRRESHNPRLEENCHLEPGELASITEFDLDETFWWVWISSLAGEETSRRKAAFGQCVLIQTIIRGGRWLVIEEMVKRDITAPEEEDYTVEEKSFWSRSKKLTRRESPTGRQASETSKANQHARIAAAAALLQQKHDLERKAA